MQNQPSFSGWRSICYDNYILILAMLAVMMTLVAGTASAHLIPISNIEKFFITPNKRAILTWNSTSPKKKNLHYQIYNYWHHPILGHTGSAKFNAQGQVTVAVSLPRGFYTISFIAQKQTFGIDSIPAFVGPDDPFFAMDSALSHSVVGPAAHQRPDRTHGDFHALRAALVKILKRSGIASSRERLNWARLNPAKGVFHWDTAFAYNQMRQTYHQAGVGVVEMFSQSPGYLKHVGNPRRGFPRNLLGAAGAWESIAAKWRPTWSGVEIWNEPNNQGRSAFPADQYASMAKALSYALHSHDPKLLVGGPAMGGGIYPPSLVFSRDAAASGVLSVMNYWSYHSYAHALAMQHQISVWRKFMASFGRPHIPLWITESGRPWTMAAAHSPRPAMAIGQQSALDITMKAIETRACGIARFFSFVFPYTNPRARTNYGMMGLYDTPLRPFAAYAQAVSALADHAYIGDLRVHDSAIKRARVFAKGDQAVIVLYTGQAKRGASVQLNLKASQIRGIDGRLLHATSDGRIPIPDGLTYVFTARAAVAPLLDTHTEAMRLYKLGHNWPKPVQASPIVLQYLPNAKAVTAYGDGYWVNAKAAAGKLPVTIRVLNLGSRSRSMAVSVSRVGESSGESGQGTTRLAAVQQVTVKAGAVKTVTFAVNLPQISSAAITRLEATARPADAHSAGHAPKIQPTVIKLHTPITMAALLKNHPRHQKLAINQLNRWKPNHSKNAKSSFAWQNGVWRLTIHPKGRRLWSVPQFTVKAKPGRTLSQAKGVIIRGRCDHGNPTMALTRIPRVDRVGQYRPFGTLFPADGRWHAVFVPFADFTSRNVDRMPPLQSLTLTEAQSLILKVGMGARTLLGSQPAILEVSDLYLVFQ